MFTHKMVIIVVFICTVCSSTCKFISIAGERYELENSLREQCCWSKYIESGLDPDPGFRPNLNPDRYASKWSGSTTLHCKAVPVLAHTYCFFSLFCVVLWSNLFGMWQYCEDSPGIEWSPLQYSQPSKTEKKMHSTAFVFSIGRCYY